MNYELWLSFAIKTWLFCMVYDAVSKWREYSDENMKNKLISEWRNLSDEINPKRMKKVKWWNEPKEK